MRLWLDTFYWKLLMRSGVFRAWAEAFLAELVADLESADIPGEGDFLTAKYREKLELVRKHKGSRWLPSLRWGSRSR